MFSSRTPRDLALNRLASSISAHRASGRPLIDLTVTNPTAVGIHYDADLLASLSSAAALTYSPEPFGMRAARHAVVADYAARGISVAEDRIVLTASTSEAYSVLFKLLCAPEGDDVLVPQPSYPLFDHLTRLDGVSCHPYFLEYHGRWVVDERSVENAWTARTRAILAVTPNNPTGSSLSPAELSGLSRRWTAHERDRRLVRAGRQAPASASCTASRQHRRNPLERHWQCVRTPSTSQHTFLARLDCVLPET